MNRRPVDKMLYCRSVSDIADDDDPSTSVMIPVSMVRGITFYLGTVCAIYHETPYQYVQTDVGNNSFVMLTIPSGEHSTFIEALAKEIAFGDNYIITLGDKVTGEYFGNAINVTGPHSIDVTDD